MKPKDGKGLMEQSATGSRKRPRRRYSAEEKVRIVLLGLRGESSVAELCRREGIAQGAYYKWSKDFMEAGKRRLAGKKTRTASTMEMQALRRETRDLKVVVAEQTHEMQLLKNGMIGDAEPSAKVSHPQKVAER